MRRHLWIAIFIPCIVLAAPPAPMPAAATGAAPAAHAGLEEQLPLDPAIVSGRLANGLRYYIRANSRPAKRAEVWLAVNAGSVLEDEDQRGIAHFVEHMAFDGSRHFPKRQLVHYLESIGMRFGPDINASTDFDRTLYTLKVPTDRPEIVEQAFQILEDWAGAIDFDPAELERERGVVIEEWRLGRGAMARMQDQQLPILLKGSRYAERLPIGKREVLEHASRETLLRFYHDWYRPDLMAVVAVGDFDKEKIERLVRAHFAGLEPPAKARPRPSYPVPDHGETLYAIATDPEATSASVGVDVKLGPRPESSVADFRRERVEGLYYSMLNDRLAELGRKPDPPYLFAFAGSGRVVHSTDMSIATAEVSENGIARGLDAMLSELERVRRHGFTAGELERAKRKLARAYEQRYAERDKRESPQLAGQLAARYLDERPAPEVGFELALVRQLLPGIELSEVNRLAADWNAARNRVIEVSAPRKKDLAPPSEAELAAVFASVAKRDIAPWVDRAREGPLVAAAPVAGKVVSESRIEELGLTEWRLSNGVRVVLKPTDFKNDEVVLSGFAPGGLSLVPEAQFTSARLASQLAREQGVGEFDRTALSKALAGKLAGVGLSLGEFEQGVGGGASPLDLDTMFQLAYLSLTAPRRDPEAARSFLAKEEAALKNRLARPEAVFSDKLTEVLSQNHPRERPLTVESLREVDPEVAYRVLRDRFADAGQFIFFLVGSFKPEQVRGEVETWLGGLPAHGRKESWRDVGVRPPAGVQRFAVTKGLEPKSLVRIVFTGDAKYNRENLHDIGALGNALRIRLREILREDLGAVYAVSAGGGLDYRPREKYQFAISFGCAPEKVDALVGAVFAEIAAIQKQGVAAPVLQKVKEAERREREVALRENRFWVGVLASYYRSGWDPRGILRFDELIERVTSERMRDLARQYLQSGRYVLGVLLPEAAPAARPGR